MIGVGSHKESLDAADGACPIPDVGPWLAPLLNVVPLLLGDGEQLFEGLGPADVSLEQVEAIDAPGVAHLKYRRA